MSYGLTKEQRDLIEWLRGFRRVPATAEQVRESSDRAFERYGETFRKLAEIERRELMRNVSVKIKRLHPDAVVPAYAKPGDAGFDLVAIEDVVIAPGETAKVRTGLAFEIPEGFELQIRPRSGISAKTKLRVSNAPGTVDSGYRGEVCVLVDNIRHPEYTIEGSDVVPENDYCVINVNREEEYGVTRKYPIGTHIIRRGDRIAQGVVAPVYRAAFEVVDELGETERGEGGFGSSGVRAEVSE